MTIRSNGATSLVPLRLNTASSVSATSSASWKTRRFQARCESVAASASAGSESQEAQQGGGTEQAPLVVATREKGKNGKLMKALSAQGVSVMELPLIQHSDGPDTHRLPAVLREEQFEWIVVTSPEAASVFLTGWRAAGSPALRLAVVGGGTAEVFHQLPADEQQLLPVQFVPSKATAKYLSAEIPEIDGGNRRVLYPASAKASHDLENGLASRGFLVTRLNTYSTESVTSVDEDTIRRAAKAPVVAVASPTAVRAWMEVVASRTQWDGAAACIGGTSAEAARRAGIQRVFAPDSPGIESWVASVMEALEAAPAEA
ncbi:hypothetical protein CLOM_g24491 [Closterium sp. NIES-68]|nr:hypothetical protein CLOM_g24491 [Closterium sp. NIES-68]GJP75484.1 hypothetical protein CLOP_g5928 [Closterium sp. NIES-67]